MNLPFSFPKGSPVLIAGVGGGYDFLCGLPVALTLLEAGHPVFFANYAFSRLDRIRNATWVADSVLQVTADSTVPDGEYCPEIKLARWFRERKHLEIPVFCFRQVGIRSLTKAYDALAERFSLPNLIAVDGGVDGLFRGDEADLGTPSMDAISIIAGSLARFERRIFTFTAFGSEGVGYEVSHAQALERVADLIRQEAFLGVSSVLGSQSSGSQFQEAVQSVERWSTPEQASNIVSSLLKAMDGRCGETAVNAKTQERKIWVSPLTLLYWFADLVAVARLKLFYEAALGTDSVAEVADLIAATRQRTGIRRRDSIPI